MDGFVWFRLVSLCSLSRIGVILLSGCAQAGPAPGESPGVVVTLSWIDTEGQKYTNGYIIYWNGNKLLVTNGLLQDQSAASSEAISDLELIGVDINYPDQQKCGGKMIDKPLMPGLFTGNYNICVKMLRHENKTFYIEVTTRARGQKTHWYEVTLRDRFSVKFDVPCQAQLMSAEATSVSFARVQEGTCRYLVRR